MTRRPSFRGLAGIVPDLVEALESALPVLESLALEEKRRNGRLRKGKLGSLQRSTAFDRWQKAVAALALAAEAAQDDGAAK
jgi:hypothetical protein